MKCSLLTLSTFIDEELSPERSAEVDAHLVGCPRCSAGAATLREEKGRVAQLARVTVDPSSVQLMLEQVGITVASDMPRPPMPAAAPPEPPGTQLPWQGGDSGLTLPWTPRRPAAGSADEEMAVPTVAPDVQPDLPFEGARITPQASEESAEASPGVEAAGSHPSPPVEAIEDGRTAPELERVDTAAALESWEADLPAPALAPEADEQWRALGGPVHAPAPVQPPDPPVLAPPSVAVTSTQAPTRLAPVSGPAAVWRRARDAVAVRLALARGADAVEDSLQIVNRAPSRPAAELQPPSVVAPPLVGASAGAPSLEAGSDAQGAVELSGKPGVGRPSPAMREAGVAAADVHVRDEVADRAPTHWSHGDEGSDEPAPTDPGDWNAFAASSYPSGEASASPGQLPAPAPRHLGRHSRAVAREQVDVVTRVGRALAAMAVAVRGRAIAAVGAARQAIGSVSSAGPDNRMLGGIAGVGLIFVIALLIGHSSSPSTRPAAAVRPAPTAASSLPSQSAPAPSSGAPTQPAAAAPSHVQTYGGAGTGFQVLGLRYGAQVAYMRVVFDLGAASVTSGGTPRVVVAFSDPKTLLVTFDGTVPAGLITKPPAGSVISSVTLVSNGGRGAEYRLVLTRAVTTTAFYLRAPSRFVLDLH